MTKRIFGTPVYTDPPQGILSGYRIFPFPFHSVHADEFGSICSTIMVSGGFIVCRCSRAYQYRKVHYVNSYINNTQGTAR